MSDELAAGWVDARLGDLLSSLLDFRGRTPKKLGMDWGGGEIPALSALNVRADRLDLSRTKHFGSEALYRRWMTNGDVTQGDIVVTTEAPLGNVALIPDQRRYILSQRVILLKCGPAVDSAFLAHQLRSPEFRARLVHEETGTGVTGIRQSRFVELTARVPPLAEQRRIVAQVEALLARVSAARERLEKVPLLMKRFRQSVLAKAFRGELVPTEAELAAREGRSFQSAQELLGLPADSVSDDLPDGWARTKLSEVIESSFYGPRFASTAYVSKGIPTIRTTDMDPLGMVVFRDPPKVSVDERELEKFGLRDGDLLVTRTGTIGRCALYSADLGPAIPSAYLIRFRLRRDRVEPRFVLMFLSSSDGQAQFGLGTTAVAQPNINARTLGDFDFTLPLLSEQRRIVAKVDALFAVAAKVEAEAARQLKVLARAPQAILQKAFSGELVPTEAELARAEGRSFESASELLARINRSDSAAEPSSPRRRRRQRVEQTAT